MTRIPKRHLTCNLDPVDDLMRIDDSLEVSIEGNCRGINPSKKKAIRTIGKGEGNAQKVPTIGKV